MNCRMNAARGVVIGGQSDVGEKNQEPGEEKICEWGEGEHGWNAGNSLSHAVTHATNNKRRSTTLPLSLAFAFQLS